MIDYLIGTEIDEHLDYIQAAASAFVIASVAFEDIEKQTQCLLPIEQSVGWFLDDLEHHRKTAEYRRTRKLAAEDLNRSRLEYREYLARKLEWSEASQAEILVSQTLVFLKSAPTAFVAVYRGLAHRFLTMLMSAGYVVQLAGERADGLSIYRVSGS
jgi:hypothetical protein